MRAVSRGEISAPASTFRASVPSDQLPTCNDVIAIATDDLNAAGSTGSKIQSVGLNSNPDDGRTPMLAGRVAFDAAASL